MSEQQVEDKQPKQSDFTADINDLGPCKKVVRVQYPSKIVSGEVNKEFASIKKRAQLRGFRKGKAPRKVLNRLYGEQINEYVKATLIDKAVEELVAEHPVVTAPEPTDVQFDPKGELSFELTLMLRPIFELPNLEEGEWEVEVKRVNVSEEDVDTAISTSMANESEFENVDDGTIELEDVVVADIELWLANELELYTQAEDDASDFSPIIEIEDHEITLSDDATTLVAGVVVKALADDLQGRQVDDEISIDVVIPDDVEVAEARGQAGVLKFDINEIKRKAKVELNEEFAVSKGFDNVEALRTRVREDLLEGKTKANDEEIGNKVVDQILKQVGDFALPRDIVEAETQNAAQRLMQESKQKGMSEAQIDVEIADRSEELQAQTMRDLRRFFVLDEVTKFAEIKVTDDELRSHIAQLARSLNIDLATFVEIAKQQLSDIRWQLQEAKALDYLRKLAKVNEVG